jgi:hypothetical protein
VFLQSDSNSVVGWIRFGPSHILRLDPRALGVLRLLSFWSADPRGTCVATWCGQFGARDLVEAKGLLDELG